MPFDYQTDVVIVGATPAAFAAALKARELGFEALVLGAGAAESQSRTARWDDDLLWLPDDDYATVRDYLDRTLGPTLDQWGAPRRHAFVGAVLGLRERLGQWGVKLKADDLPDHYPELASGRESGRVWRAGAGVASALPFSAGALVPKTLAGTPLLETLTQAAREREASAWHNTVITELLVDRLRVVGVRAHRAGRDITIGATRAVVLADGGFGSDAALRREFLPGTRPSWQLGGADDHGATLGLLNSVDADLASMDAAWGAVGIWDESSRRAYDASDTARAGHCLIVDGAAKRIVNEAAPAAEIQRALLASDGSQCWLIGDATHRKKTALGPLAAGRTPKSARDSATIVSAPTFGALARALHLEPADLAATVDRFNQAAVAGEDADFGRGRSAWDRRGGRGAAATLAPLDKGPYFAVRVVPADWGTKGGAAVDELGHVLRDGQPIAGLFAVGDAAGSLTRDVDPAPGFRTSEALASALALEF